MRLFALFLCLIQSTYGLADELSDRLVGFSSIKESHASFVEAWTADYLEEPLISKGKLSYKRPGKLIKNIEHPESVMQIIEGDQLTVIRNGKTHSIQLSDEPLLATGIYALRDVLEGNKNNLQNRFEIIYTELNEGWNIILTPKDNQVAKKIKVMILKGCDNRIFQISIEYRNGDNLLTDISHD